MQSCCRNKSLLLLLLLLLIILSCCTTIVATSSITSRSTIRIDNNALSLLLLFREFHGGSNNNSVKSRHQNDIGVPLINGANNNIYRFSNNRYQQKQQHQQHQKSTSTFSSKVRFGFIRVFVVNNNKRTQTIIKNYNNNNSYYYSSCWFKYSSQSLNGIHQNNKNININMNDNANSNSNDNNNNHSLFFYNNNENNSNKSNKNKKQNVDNANRRRSFLFQSVVGIPSIAALETVFGSSVSLEDIVNAATGSQTSCIISSNGRAAFAAVTDETDNFANNWWTNESSAPSTLSSPTKSTTIGGIDQKSNRINDSDVVSIDVQKSELKKRIKESQGKEGLGIELADIEFRTNIRVYVKSVQPNSYGSKLGIQKDWIVIGINNQSTERTNSQGVAMYLKQALEDGTNDNDSIITIRFRDPSIFRSQLKNMESTIDSTVSTQIAPSGDTTIYNRDGTKIVRSSYQQNDQKIIVSQVSVPSSSSSSSRSSIVSTSTTTDITTDTNKYSNNNSKNKIQCSKSADIDDLIEISYTGTIVETGSIFDGSAVRINGNGIPGRGDDVTIYFVLGKQPYGQFPPGWDIGLYGSCIGERRRIIIPPALGYGSTGVPRRNIPPNATLQYDVTIVSINGISAIQ